MKYSFFTKEIANAKYVCVQPEIDSYKILARFTDDNWTEAKIVDIKNRINGSKDFERGSEYIWANEDVTLYSNKNGVLLEDMISQRFGENSVDELTLRLEHDEFLQFLEDFKKFVKANS